MTEDKKTFNAEGLPPFPWRCEGNVISDAGHDEILKAHPFADGLAAVVTESMNQLAEDGRFMSISEFNEQVHNDLITSVNALTQRNETLRRAIELIEKYRETSKIDRANEELVTMMHTPAELLDVLHDVLTSGGANAFEREMR